jgi:hypothetical protein
MIGFGKHGGHSAAMVVLKDPRYAVWLLGQEGATRMFRETQQEVRQLIGRFDEKPIRTTCASPGCGQRATRASVYAGSVHLMWFCDACDPGQVGASPGKLEILRSYWDAVAYVGNWCNGRKTDLAVLIKEMAHARGLPERVGEHQAVAFFR